MLWHASITPQRLAPRGEAVMTCAGEPGFLDRSTTNQQHQRWRS
jgi:hypothetical protein